MQQSDLAKGAARAREKKRRHRGWMRLPRHRGRPAYSQRVLVCRRRRRGARSNQARPPTRLFFSGARTRAHPPAAATLQGQARIKTHHMHCVAPDPCLSGLFCCNFFPWGFLLSCVFSEKKRSDQPSPPLARALIQQTRWGVGGRKKRAARWRSYARTKGPARGGRGRR